MMPIFDAMKTAMRDLDTEAYFDLLHDDFQLVRHQTGTTLNKSEMIGMVRSMMESGKWSVSDQRCLYENDDILVVHSIMRYPDGSKEAVMSVNMKKDGKVVRTETGATLLAD